MGTVLQAFSSPTHAFTLRDFTNNPQMVFDMMVEIPSFVDEQYGSGAPVSRSRWLIPRCEFCLKSEAIRQRD